MRIQHNIAAMNSYRQLGGNNNALSKNLEKLSSGFRINRAGDDAAGLAISEKMRAQIKGLETAQKNANDGISLIQTAEGALTEVHSMLNRMTELATQSANGTYDNDVDRANLQKEITALKDEINRISDSTNFNGIDLLNGEMGKLTGITMGETDAVAGQLIGSVGTIAGTVEANMVKGTDAVYSEQTFIMADVFQATGSGTAAGELKLTLTLQNGTGTTQDKIDIVLKADDNDKTVSATLQQIVDALNQGSSSVSGATNAGGTNTITLTPGNNSKFTNLGDVAATYKFEIDDNGSLVVKTKDQATSTTSKATEALADKFGVAGVALTFTQAQQSDKDKVEEWLTEKYDGTNENKIAIGTELAGKPGALATPDEYQVASATVTLDDSANHGKALHGKALQVGDKVYIMNDLANKDGLSKDLQKLIEDGRAERVDYNSKKTFGSDNLSADKALAAAIQKNSKDTGITVTAVTGATGKLQLMETDDQAKKVLEGTATSIDMKNAVRNSTLTTGAKDAYTKLTLTNKLEDGTRITFGNKTYEFAKDPTTVAASRTAIQLTEGDVAANVAALQAQLRKDGLADVKLQSDGTTFVVENTSLNVSASSKGLTLQVGDTAESFQKVSIVVGDMDCEGLGIADVNIETQEGAALAIDKIKNAINKVSSTRGDLGAVQNRLEHTINNLGVTTENITAAESRIRDTDMAAEMMQYTKNNILIQASQAMLAQANQVPQGVLQLLQ